LARYEELDSPSMVINYRRYRFGLNVKGNLTAFEGFLRFL